MTNHFTVVKIFPQKPLKQLQLLLSTHAKEHTGKFYEKTNAVLILCLNGKKI